MNAERAMTDGPNTHKYRDAHHITSWTIVPLDDVDGVRHFFHVPTVILAAERTLARLALDPGLVPEPVTPSLLERIGEWWRRLEG